VVRPGIPAHHSPAIAVTISLEVPMRAVVPAVPPSQVAPGSGSAVVG